MRQAMVKKVLAIVPFLLLWLAAPSAKQAPALTSCGGEGEAACRATEIEFVENGTGACDNGLRSLTYRCGCSLRGLRGNCLVPAFCTRCVNDTRKLPAGSGFGSTWESWALRNQRTLAIDEPINRALHLGAHNAYNTTVDDPANLAPNQYYSITDQLRLGARRLSLDIHHFNDFVRVCHGNDQLLELLPGTPPEGCGRFERLWANAVKEIRNWLRANPSEILLMTLEDHVGDDDVANARVNLPLERYLGGTILSVADLERLKATGDGTAQRWPTRRELLAAGKRVIINGRKGHGAGSIHTAGFFPWSRHGGFLQQPNYKLDLKLTPDLQPNWRFDAENRACWSGRDLDPADFCRQSDGSRYKVCYSENADQVGGIEEARWLLFPTTRTGLIEEADVAAAVRCNVVSVGLDFFAAKERAPFSASVFDLRQRFAVWSWKYGDRGAGGDCALLDADATSADPLRPGNQWESAPCGEVHRFACARPRSESGLDPLDWTDPLGHDWCITTSAGAWDDGVEMCRSECPGYVFSVPVNGYQNVQLNLANTGASDLWLHYTDRDREGSWIIPRIDDNNSPPIADAGPDQAVECGTAVTLDGRGSFDADGDPLTYTWSGPFGTADGAVGVVDLDQGEHAVTLAVDDGAGGTDTDTAQITIADTTPPAVTLSLSPSSLWPANHKLADVHAVLDITDACGSPDIVELVSVTSNEHDNGPGDGHAAPDVQGAEPGTDDREFQVRAERSGRGSGRVYTVTYAVSDVSGNTTEASATVTVAHDARR